MTAQPGDFQVFLNAGDTATYWLDDIAAVSVTAERVKTAVDERGKQRGMNPYFGDLSAHEAVYKLAQWIYRLPDEDRAAVERYLGGL